MALGIGIKPRKDNSEVEEQDEYKVLRPSKKKSDVSIPRGSERESEK